MANLRTFNAAGITVQNGDAKVRFSQSLDRRIKRYVKLKADRVDIFALPNPMTKLEALDFLSAMPEFSADSDQETIRLERAYQIKAAERLDPDRVPRKRGRPAKAEGTVKVKAAKQPKAKAKPSLDAIRARARKNSVSVSDVLAAVAPAAASVETSTVSVTQTV